MATAAKKRAAKKKSPEERAIEKRERFENTAVGRTQKAVDLIHLLGNCANKASYDYTPDEVEKLFGFLDDAIKATRKKFDVAMHGRVKSKTVVTLDESAIG